jgi:ABC-2 type transport system permease protein
MVMLRRVLTLATKDLRVLFSSFGGVFFTFVFPLLFVFGFSMALEDVGEDDQVEIHVATAELPGSIGAGIVQQLTGLPGSPFRQLTPDDAARRLDDGEIAGYILFPADLSGTLTGSGAPTALRVIVDPNAAETAALLQGIAGSLARDMLLRQASVATSLAAIRAAGQDPGAHEAAIVQAAQQFQAPQTGVTLQTRQVGEIEPVPASSYVLTGYVTMFLFFAAGFGAGELIRERTNQTLERMVAMGVERSTILAGKWVGGAARGLLQAVVMWVVGITLFGVEIGPEPLGVALATLAMLAASVSFTLFLASIVSTARAADSATVLASLILAAIGGSWWPLFIMPDWMQTLAKLSPHAWANDAFNKLMLFGATISDVWVNLAVLFGLSAVFALLATRRLRLAAV